MKKHIILTFLIFLLASSLYCELDFQHTGTFSENYSLSLQGKNLVKNNDRILLITQYGVEIYETSEDGLTEVASYDLPMVFGAALFNDTMALIFDNIDGNPYYRDIINIYDISNIEEPQLIHQIETNLYRICLKDNVIILGHHNQVSIVSTGTLEVLNTYPNTFFGSNVEDSDYFTIQDTVEDSYYLCYLDNEGQIIRYKNLGPNSGRIRITEDKLLDCYEQSIDFYTVADSLEFVKTFQLNYFVPLSLSGLCVFDNTMVVLVEEFTPPQPSYLAYFDISDVQNIVELNRYEFLPEFGYDRRFSVWDSAQWNDNYLFVIEGYGVIYSDYNNHLDDYNLLKYQRKPRFGNIYNNHLYLNYRNIMYFNTVYDITDINNITQLETADTLGLCNWFGEEENQFVVKQNLIDETLDLYSFSDNNFQYIDSYDMDGYVNEYQIYVKVLYWDGEDLIYNFFQNLYWVRYENGSFSDVHISEVYQPDPWKKWFYYNDYLYNIWPSGVVKVYSKEDNGIELINTITGLHSGDSFSNNWGITDGLFCIEAGNVFTPTRVYDLDVDPVNFTAELDLNIGILNSKIIRHGDYYLYTGSDMDNATHQSKFESLSYLNIYKKVGDEFVKVGDIYNNRQTWDLEIVAQDENNFTLFLCSTRGVDVYTCHATPNGDLEITPVTLNATNYPNPFNPETTISYDVNQKGSVTVDIYNLKGQKVKSLVNENKEAGTHSIIWRGDNDQGKQVSSGTYFYRIKNAGHEVVKKMLLMK